MNKEYGSYGFLNRDRISPSPLRLCDFGVEYREKEPYEFWNQDRGTLEGYILQFTFEGYGIFEREGKVTKLEEGKGFFVSLPDDSRYYLPTENTQPWKYFYMHFTGAMVEPFYQQIQQLDGAVFSINVDSDPVRLFFDEYNGVRNGKKYREYESGIFLHEFLVDLLREIESPFDGKENPLVEEAVQWIHRHYTKELCLLDMCRQLVVSAEHLSRVFHDKKGITLMKYLTNVRLEHSMDLLLNTPMTVDQIGVQCGFSGGNYFAKVFRKGMNMTPSAYRKERGGRGSSFEGVHDYFITK